MEYEVDCCYILIPLKWGTGVSGMISLQFGQKNMILCQFVEFFLSNLDIILIVI